MSFIDQSSLFIRNILLSDVRRVPTKSNPTYLLESLHNFGDALMGFSLVRAMNNPRWTWYGRLDEDIPNPIFQKGSWLNSAFHLTIRTAFVAASALQLSHGLILPGKLLQTGAVKVISYAILGAATLTLIGIMIKTGTYLISEQVKANYYYFEEALKKPNLDTIPEQEPTPQVNKLQIAGASEEDCSFLESIITSEKAANAWQTLDLNGKPEEPTRIHNLFIANYKTLVEGGKWKPDHLRQYLEFLPKKHFTDPNVLDLIEYYLAAPEAKSDEKITVARLASRLLGIYLGKFEGEKPAISQKRAVQFLSILNKREFLESFKAAAPGHKPSIDSLMPIVNKFSKQAEKASTSPRSKQLFSRRPPDQVEVFKADEFVTTAINRERSETDDLWKTIEEKQKEIVLIGAYAAVACKDWDAKQIQKFVGNCPDPVFKEFILNEKTWFRPTVVTGILDRFLYWLEKNKLNNDEFKDIIHYSITPRKNESQADANERFKIFWKAEAIGDHLAKLMGIADAKDKPLIVQLRKTP